MTRNFCSFVVFVLIAVCFCNASVAESSEKEKAPQQAHDAAAQANNPLANMTAFNLQNYYIGELTESDDAANQFWLRYAQPLMLGKLTMLSVIAGILLLALPICAQEKADETAELAKKLANPIASLISVPIQGNLDFGIGSTDAQKLTVNIQPVIPFSLNSEWNLITRTIFPVIYAEAPAPGLDSTSGLGDITQSFFLSPKEPVGGWIMGAGPVLLYPSATEKTLGSEKWGAGPTAVILKQQSGFTYQ